MSHQQLLGIIPDRHNNPNQLMCVGLQVRHVDFLSTTGTVEDTNITCSRLYLRVRWVGGGKPAWYDAQALEVIGRGGH